MLLLDAAAVDGEPVRGRVELTVYGAASLSYGQRVAVHASLRTAEPDWLFYDRYRGVACRARAEGLPGVAPGRRDAYGLLLAVRAAISERIGLLFPAGAQAEAARGILLGGGVADMDEGTEAQFRAVGIAHLLAVSGLHVGVLAGALMAPLRLVRGLWARFFHAGGAAAAVCGAHRVHALGAARVRDGALRAAGHAAAAAAGPDERALAGVRAGAAGKAVCAVERGVSVVVSGRGRAGAAGKAAGAAVCRAGEPGARRRSRAGWRWSWRDCRRRRGFFGALPLSSLAANLLVLPLVPLFFVPALLALGLGAVWLPLGRAVAVLPQAALELILRVAEAGGRARAHSARAGDGRVPAVPAVDAAQLAAVPGAGAAKAPAQRRRRAAHRTALVMVTGSFFFFMFSFLSGERKENQKRKPGTRLGWPAAPARQRRLPSPQKIFCGAFLSEKPRREKWITD